MAPESELPSREDRLASKLRENLRRRKAQGRDMARQLGESSEDSPADALPNSKDGG